MEIELDQSNMRQVIMEYPTQLHLGQQFAKHIALPQKAYSNLVICGMGGSAIAGDLLVSYLDANGRVDMPIYICRSYELPEDATSDSLIFIISYSGNTEETIACFEEALKTKATVLAISKGGKVQQIAEKNHVPFVQLDFQFEHFEPRYAAPYIFTALHQILTNAGLTDKIQNLPKTISRDLEILGEEIAKEIKGKTPIIYASDRYSLLAKNWKIKINENAKTPAFWNCFPELNHNEMVGFTLPQAKFYVVMLAEKDDHPRNLKRMGLTAKLYKDKGVKCRIVSIEGKSFLEKVVNTLVLGDWVSYYLALEYEQDPTPVAMVEHLKESLK